MKWFFGLNEQALHFGAYAEMAKVAVLSARRHTRLEPILLFDGSEGAFTSWMRERGVHVVFHRSSIHPALEEQAKSQPHFLRDAPGIFLRMDIPDVCRRFGWSDETVLYTDCDVMFAGDPEPMLPDTHGTFFAVGPESAQDCMELPNTGVMLMRVSALRSTLEAFRSFVVQALPQLARSTWDQRAYQVFYRHGWTALPIELNWKPYWGHRDTAKIVHFHGPKPFLREAILKGTAEPVQRALANDAYFAYCRAWDDYAALAKN